MSIDKEKFMVGLIVANHHGVLNRVAGLYSKRGYNIDSLAVGETEDASLSRMTIVSTGDDYIREQVVKQLNKLHDVKKAVLLDMDDAVSVEHLLIKIKINGEGNADIADLINSFSGKVADFSEGCIIADITGGNDQINDFIERCRPSGILEICRSGLISLSRGMENLLGIHDVNKF
ncbi:MAG: acetolactate synthase small subunit [Clostridia bacterium]|nr:acetolactate synthase small subunit [Clostridia bacterium]